MQLPCTVLGQLQKIERAKIMNNMTGNCADTKAGITVKMVFDGNQSGSIFVYKISIENAKEIRKIVGYLPQDFSMYPNMSIIEAMDYFGILSGIGIKERRDRIEFLLKKVNLTQHKNKKVKAFSSGMKYRLSIAQVLLNDPKVLIVDKPTAELDPEERIRFRNLLYDVVKKRIVILSTYIVCYEQS